MKKFLIDGRFLTSLSTGVDRYAWEIIKELDKICDDINVTLLVPASVMKKNNDNTRILQDFQHIRLKESSIEKCWTQGVFAMRARLGGYIPVNLCNEVAVLAPKGITALHDVCYAEENDFFPEEERQWFLKIYERVKKHCNHVITVSEFSKKRIVELLGISADKITVAGNGWQHFNRVDVNEKVFEKHPQLKKGEYYFTLASANKNKNVAWVVDNAARSERLGREEIYVVGGKNLDQVFDFSRHKNIVYVGFLEDCDIKAYVKYCKAFIFPSFYEGFGIPPLEAASAGARIVVSDRASLPEICGDAAVYINPDNPNVDLDQLLAIDDEVECENPEKDNQISANHRMSHREQARQQMLSRYSWGKSAHIVYELLREYESEGESR